MSAGRVSNDDQEEHDQKSNQSSTLTDSSSSSYTSSHQKRDGLRMIEFFSGIGGMRYGVERALEIIQQQRQQQQSPSAQFFLSSCIAYEISLQANATYAHNFSHDTEKGKNKAFYVKTKLVEQLKPKDLDNQADLWTMSPPCQPFTTTRNAKQNGSQDKRTNGFKALMNLLRSIQHKPMWILLENVKGFVGSSSLQEWYECLHECGYTWREYLLNPIQSAGIPNNRTRYYMICERSDRWKSKTTDMAMGQGQIFTTLQKDETHEFINNNDSAGNQNHSQEHDKYEVKPLCNFVRDVTKEELPAYLVPDDVLSRPWAKQLPVVTAQDKATYCFTAAYGRIYHKATGSFLLIDPPDRPACADVPIERCDDMSQLYSGKIRRFTPDELLAIFGFPSSFSFPFDISLEKCYKLIGNSVNIFVVTQVATELLMNIK
mmetsp:Transcript_29432/g.43376  ORF Transcript_29432/g.43376 Transcript_29432/m.43376 type:complete len:431 (+) Transcript_29432:27-1319(+)